MKNVKDERKKFLSDRQKGVGGSDIAKLANVSVYDGPFHVWLSKVEPVEEEAKWNDSARYGSVVEKAIVELWMQKREFNGNAPQDISFPDTLVHAEHAILRANVDGIVLDSDGEKKILEIKTAKSWKRDDWGEEFTAEIPIAYKYQVAYYCMITGIRKAVIVVEIDHVIHEYHYTHDPFDILFGNQVLQELALNFWNNYVSTMIPPESDGGKTYTEWVKINFPTYDDGEIVEVDNDDPIVESLRSYSIFAETKKEVEKELQKHKNAICQFIGDREGVKGDFGKFTWRRSGKGRRVNSGINKHWAKRGEADSGTESGS